MEAVALVKVQVPILLQVVALPIFVLIPHLYMHVLSLLVAVAVVQELPKVH